MRIFSGIQPTGQLHIGNYSGAIKQWIDYQHDYECLFCIVDLHAITTPYDKKNFQKFVIDQATSYIAVGLDPRKVDIFVQSRIKEHTELFWLLNTITPLGELYRMTQFKEKSKKHNNNLAGLLNYPILMAADILLYDTEIVPVGEDQKQHVEIARKIARKFNTQFGETFKIPQAKLSTGRRIMSLTNPTKKMSKSDERNSYISLFDSPLEIEKKIMSAVTDTDNIISYNPENKPGISNLLTIYSVFSEIDVKKVEKDMQQKNYKTFKEELTSLVISKLEPFKKEKEKLANRDVYIEEILKQGERKARHMAETKMAEIKRKMGLRA